MGLNEELAECNKEIEQNPNDYAAYHNRGITYFNMGQLDSAIADFSKAIALNPNFAASYFVRGVVYGGKGQTDSKLADLNKAIELDPNDAHFYWERGSVYDSRKQFDVAVSDFDKAIELEPNNAEFYRSRGRAYFFMPTGSEDKLEEHNRKALSDFNKVIEECGSTNLRDYYFRGDAYRRTKQWALARADLRKVMNEVAPGDPSELHETAKSSLDTVDSMEHYVGLPDAGEEEKQSQERTSKYQEKAAIAKAKQVEREEAERIRNERDYKTALTDLDKAKSEVDTAETSADFEKLIEKIVQIAKMLQSLPISFEKQAQIEECETYRKKCETEIHKREENEQNRRDYETALTDLEQAKSNVNAARTAADFKALCEKFSQIKEKLWSLPISFEKQTQIDECETCCKKCEEKYNQLKKDETLAWFNEAKARKLSTLTTGAYSFLVTEFTNIGEDLKALSSSFGLQAEIAECEAYRKKWEEKRTRSAKKESAKRARDQRFQEIEPKNVFRVIAAVLMVASVITGIIGLVINGYETASVGTLVLIIIAFLVVFFAKGWIKKALSLFYGLFGGGNFIFFSDYGYNLFYLIAGIGFIVSCILAMICPKD